MTSKSLFSVARFHQVHEVHALRNPRIPPHLMIHRFPGLVHCKYDNSVFVSSIFVFFVDDASKMMLSCQRNASILLKRSYKRTGFLNPNTQGYKLECGQDQDFSSIYSCRTRCFLRSFLLNTVYTVFNFCDFDQIKCKLEANCEATRFVLASFENKISVCFCPSGTIRKK